MMEGEWKPKTFVKMSDWINKTCLGWLRLRSKGLDRRRWLYRRNCFIKGADEDASDTSMLFELASIVPACDAVRRLHLNNSSAVVIAVCRCAASIFFFFSLISNFFLTFSLIPLKYQKLCNRPKKEILTST